MTAEEFKEFKETETEEKVQMYFDSLLFRTFNIMVKGKFEFFNGENRMRFFAVKVFPHNVQAENRALLRRIELYRCLAALSTEDDGEQMTHQQAEFSAHGSEESVLI